MAQPLPAALRIPEVSRFVNRALQLRTVKPAIAYWCEYHAVNQIVAKGLHTADDDAFAYTRALIERLETTKAARADDDAVVDNDAGRAYVEQFALDTFARAERTLRANKVTRQTADTFDAAATFFDLTREWGDPDAETLQKIKFAKWNAARILKAIRDGADPNESNPRPVSPGPADADAVAGPSPPLPASVEDVPDAGEPAARPLPPSPPPPAEEAYPRPEPSAPLSAPFPDTVPSPSFQPPPAMTSPAAWAPGPSAPPAAPAPAPAPVAAPAPAPAPAAPAMNHRDIAQAQKHAKWAISALNFEDVPTAVRELRNALATLGAQ